MQITSPSTSKLSSLPLALQSARSRRLGDQPVSTVGPRNEAEPQDEPLPEPLPRKASLTADIEKKLGKLKDVQWAFHAALNTAKSIQDQFLFDPIV